MTQLSQIGSDEIHSLVNTFLISFPNLKCTSKVCAYGTCMKGRGNSLNLETCYCKRNYYGDSCQNRVDNIELDPDMMKQQQQNNSPPDWNKLYHTIFLLSSFTLVCLVVAMFIVGYFVGKNSKSTTVIASNPHMFNNSNNGNHIKTNHTSNTHNNLATHSSNNLNATGGPTSRLITQKTLPPMNSFPSVSALSVFSRVNSRLNSPDREHPNKSDHLLKENNTINDYEKAVRDSSTFRLDTNKKWCKV